MSEKLKVKVSSLVSAREALTELATYKLPVKGAYWVARLIKKIEPEWQVVEDKRMALVKEFGNEDDKGNLSVPNERLKDFMDKWTPILEEEIEFEAIKLTLEHFGNVDISPAIMVRIEEFMAPPT